MPFTAVPQKFPETSPGFVILSVLKSPNFTRVSFGFPSGFVRAFFGSVILQLNFAFLPGWQPAHGPPQLSELVAQRTLQLIEVCHTEDSANVCNFAGFILKFITRTERRILLRSPSKIDFIYKSIDKAKNPNPQSAFTNPFHRCGITSAFLFWPLFLKNHLD